MAKPYYSLFGKKPSRVFSHTQKQQKEHSA